MMKWLIRKRLAAFERQFGYDTSYMKHVLDTDLGAFLRFARTSGVSSYREDAPLDVYYAVKITAVVAADCGPCAQLVVGMALADGLPAATIAKILQADESVMTDNVRLGVRFARAVLARDAAADELREQIATRWGPRAVISLGFALVSSQIYPTLKYALGYGKACQRIVVEGTAIVPRHAA
jgi:hypothetical protein